MSQSLIELNNTMISQLMPDYKEIGKVFKLVKTDGVKGHVTIEELEQLIETAMENCNSKRDQLRNSGQEYEEQDLLLLSYKKALERGKLLIQEINKKHKRAEELSGILGNVGSSVASCGATIEMFSKNIYIVNTENVINDLVDKILQVETAYNAGEISIEKAYKHVQMIKNTFNHYNIQKTGNKELDDEIDFLKYAIDESEQMYKSEVKVETTKQCQTTEFLDEKTDSKIQDLNGDLRNLANCLGQLNKELPHQAESYNMDLDWIYSQIQQIEEMDNITPGQSREFNEKVHELDSEIDLTRGEVSKTSIALDDCSQIAQTAISITENLQEKTITEERSIVSKENAMRVGKVSTQLDILDEISKVNNAEPFNEINKLLVTQSTRCLETNPELLSQINENREKSKSIEQNLAVSV